MNRRLLSTRLFTVEHRVFTAPDGGEVHRDVVVHPGAVVIVPVLDDGRIVMIRNFRYSVYEELWELPAGTIEPDEPPEATAARELQEETGYRAGRMVPLMQFYTSPGFCTERMHAFVATELTHVGQNLAGSERIVVEPVARDEVRRWLLDGRLRDGKTIAVLGRYFLQPAD